MAKSQHMGDVSPATDTAEPATILAAGPGLEAGGPTTAPAKRAALLDILFLAQLPPPLHGQSMMAMRTYRIMADDLGHSVTHLWDGGAAGNADVGRRSAAKYLGFLRLVLILLWRIVTFRRYDIAYMGIAPWSHALLRDAVLAMLAKRVAQRVLVHVHGNGIERITEGKGLFGKAVRAMFRGTEILAITEGIAASARRSGIFRRVSTFPNTSPDPGEPVGFDDAALSVATLCNLDPRKGVLDFVAAVEAAVGRGAKLRAAIAGGSTAAMTVDDLRVSVVSTNRPGIVEVLGPVDEAQKNRLLAGTDVFLYLSRHDLAPLALIEAMSHGCVPIVLDIGGMREMLGPGLARNVLSPGLDSEELIDVCQSRLRRYAEDSEALARDRRAARDRYKEAFGPERFRQAIGRILDNE